LHLCNVCASWELGLLKGGWLLSGWAAWVEVLGDGGDLDHYSPLYGVGSALGSSMPEFYAGLIAWFLVLLEYDDAGVLTA